MFPASREVDRWIYSEEAEREARYFLFSAPREVDREIYQAQNYIRAFWDDLFPAPREADRELYEQH